MRQYNDDKSISKVVLVDKQFEKIVQANKRALRSIQARAKVNERSSGDKDFDIPIGNLVLLRDHPEGRNKIQDDYKPDLFEVTGKHSDPNAFFVKPLDGKGLVKQVNRQQMFDLGVMERERREGESDQIEEDPEVPKAPGCVPRPCSSLCMVTRVLALQVWLSTCSMVSGREESSMCLLHS